MIQCGIEIVEVDRIKRVVERSGKPFLDLVFTPAEVKYSKACGVRQYHAYAGLFAAKEAILKAFAIGLGRGMKLNEIQVISSLRHKVEFFGETSRYVQEYKLKNVVLDISHSRFHAVATALIEFETLCQ